LDANVLFSAAISPKGVARAIFELADQSEDIALVTTNYAVKEALRNLKEKFPGRAAKLPHLLANVDLFDEPTAELIREVHDLVPDPHDVPILAGAVHARADLLVTGNSKDFRELYGKRVGSCLVLRPRDALDLLLTREVT